LEKLESVVDYRSTVRVLELIWTAVAIAIRIYIKKKKLIKMKFEKIILQIQHFESDISIINGLEYLKLIVLAFELEIMIYKKML